MLDFIVEVRLARGSQASTNKVSAAATPVIRDNLFVRADSEDWIPFLECESPHVQGIRLALRLLSVSSDSQVRPSPEQLQGNVLPELERLAGALDAQLEQLSNIESIPKRQEELAAAWEIGSAVAACAVLAPPGSPFDGRTIFDVMASLGFRWGDADLFHWNDELLTVSTRTSPGHFLPEDAAAGRLQVEDLVFTMPPLACCPLPSDVYDQMTKAADYVQQRLGGTIVGTDGDPLDASGDREQLGAFAEQLARIGLTPGSGAAQALLDDPG